VSVRDEDLLLRWSDGDVQAGNMLVARHFTSVYRFVRAKLDEGVDDLVQQTFLGLVEGAPRVRDAASFKAYLFGIARRQLLLHWRKQRRSSKVFSPAEASAISLALAPDTSPSRVAARRSVRRRVVEALRALPVDFQIVVELFYWESMGVHEIAAVVEVPTGTVKSRLSRAREQLEAVLQDARDDAPADLGHRLRSARPSAPAPRRRP
jgi:RNA polymerase sigma factor (sigma-70 family)